MPNGHSARREWVSLALSHATPGHGGGAARHGQRPHPGPVASCRAAAGIPGAARLDHRRGPGADGSCCSCSRPCWAPVPSWSRPPASADPRHGPAPDGSRRLASRPDQTLSRCRGSVAAERSARKGASADARSGRMAPCMSARVRADPAAERSVAELGQDAGEVGLVCRAEAVEDTLGLSSPGRADRAEHARAVLGQRG